MDSEPEHSWIPSVPGLRRYGATPRFQFDEHQRIYLRIQCGLEHDYVGYGELILRYGERHKN